MSVADACADLLAEVAALRGLVETHSGLAATEVTPFYGWRVRDTIGHMAFIDRLARLTLSDAAAFAVELGRFGQGVAAASGETPFHRIAAYEDSRLDLLSWPQLLAAWETGLAELRQAAARCDPDARVRWFGAPMRLETLLNARQMEVWGYGQDVFDLAQVRRAEADRLRNVAEFAVRTFGFSFANRGLEIPAERPFLALTAPSGTVWTWNDPAATSRVEGSAVDFCLVATQRRNVADTGLKVEGETARDWMRIAQCIAGAPVDGPAAGERVWA
jgi:uncharacterized protein (TIGR03084 family)